MQRKQAAGQSKNTRHVEISNNAARKVKRGRREIVNRIALDLYQKMILGGDRSSSYRATHKAYDDNILT